MGKDLVEPLLKVTFFKPEVIFIEGVQQTDLKNLQAFQGKEFILSTNDVSLELVSKEDSKLKLSIDKKKLSFESYSQKY